MTANSLESGANNHDQDPHQINKRVILLLLLFASTSTGGYLFSQSDALQAFIDAYDQANQDELQTNFHSETTADNISPYIAITDENGNELEIGDKPLFPRSSGLEDLTVRDLEESLQGLNDLPGFDHDITASVDIETGVVSLDIEPEGFDDLGQFFQHSKGLAHTISDTPLFKRLVENGQIVTLSLGELNIAELEEVMRDRQMEWDDGTITMGGAPISIKPGTDEEMEASFRMRISNEGEATGRLAVRGGTEEWENYGMEAILEEEGKLNLTIYTKDPDGNYHPDMRAREFVDEAFRIFDPDQIKLVETFWKPGEINHTVFTQKRDELTNLGIPLSEAERIAVLFTKEAEFIMDHFGSFTVRALEHDTGNPNFELIKQEADLPFDNTTFNLTPERAQYVVEVVDALLTNAGIDDSVKHLEFHQSYYQKVAMFMVADSLISQAISSGNIDFDTSSPEALSQTYRQMFQLYKDYTAALLSLPGGHQLQTDGALANHHKYFETFARTQGIDTVPLQYSMNRVFGQFSYSALLNFLFYDSVFTDPNQIRYQQEQLSQTLQNFDGVNNDPALLDLLQHYQGSRDHLPPFVTDYYDFLLNSDQIQEAMADIESRVHP